MSVVTGVVLCTSSAEDESILEEINAWLVEQGKPGLRVLDEHAVTSKHPQMHILGGALNGLVIHADLAQFVLSRNWRLRENVVLILQPDSGESRVIRAIGEPMSPISSWNVKTSSSADWLHYKGCTQEDALEKAAIDHPDDDPHSFQVFRSNVDDTPADWLSAYPDGNLPE